MGLKNIEKKEKVTENNSKKEGNRVPNRKIWICLDCNAN